MKFQNPSLNFFFERTEGRMHKPKPICSPLFQSWGHKKILTIETILHCTHCNYFLKYLANKFVIVFQRTITPEWEINCTKDNIPVSYFYEESIYEISRL